MNFKFQKLNPTRLSWSVVEVAFFRKHHHGNTSKSNRTQGRHSIWNPQREENDEEQRERRGRREKGIKRQDVFSIKAALPESPALKTTKPYRYQSAT
jgi:hypothetical protein